MYSIRVLVLLALLASLNGNAETLSVAESQSIQAAINRAKAGDTIKVMPGIYTESVYIDKDDIRLSGVS